MKPYYETKLGGLYHGDCLEIMPLLIENKSIDMILCDLPYGQTYARWDEIIPIDLLWKEYKRVKKETCVVALFGVEPFSSLLRVSNLRMYKYDWYWNKVKPATGFQAKHSPLKIIETISIFYDGKVYNPQMERVERKIGRNTWKRGDLFGGGGVIKKNFDNKGKKYPKNLIQFSNASQIGKINPTQKPVLLCEYLIKTYTKEEDLVLDNCIGSGTTAIACENLNRKWIGIEKEESQIRRICDRIKNRKPIDMERSNVTNIQLKLL